MVFVITLISRDENEVITRTIIMYSTSGTVKNARTVSVRTTIYFIQYDEVFKNIVF